MRSDIDPNAFLSKLFQLCDGLSDLGEVVLNKRLKTITLDALLKERYSTNKV